MAFKQEVSNVTTGGHGITQIGYGNRIELSDSVAKRRAIQLWFAPWLFDDWKNGRSQQMIIQDKGEAASCSGSWLLDDVLPNWLTSSPYDGLWLYGNVGCGKSILFSLVQNHMQQNKSEAGSSLLLSIPVVFAFNEEYTHAINFLPNTILASLCSLDPMPQGLVDAHKNHISPSQIKGIGDLVSKTVRGLEETVAKSASTQSPTSDGERSQASLILIIDALDEVPVERQKKSLDLINSLLRMNDSTYAIRVRTILFTREDLRILPYCQPDVGWLNAPIPTNEVAGDIERAVVEKLSQSRLSALSKKQLAEKVVKKAAGMFRLAILYVNEIIRTGSRKVDESVLDQLPDDLYRFYDVILSRIHIAKRRDAFRALQWTAFATGSFWLEDLVEACSLLPPNGQLFDKQVRLRLDCLDLFELLSGLIYVQPPLSDNELDEIQAGTHRVALAHFSVDEYLQQLDTSTWNIDQSLFARREANLHIAQACFACLVVMVEDATDRASYTMAHYAISAWSTHMSAAYVDETETPTSSRQTPSVALALRFKNSIEFPEIDLYDNSSELLTFVEATAKAVLNTKQRRLLVDSILRCSRDYDGGASDSLSMPPIDPRGFRILILHPSAETTSPVKCSLITALVDDAPKYQFLSYVWGNPSNRMDVTVNNYRLTIGFNLHKALVGLRHNSQARVLWVDAICINHMDLAERQHQVVQMGSVVERSQCVQTWLASESHGDVQSTGVLMPEQIALLHEDPYWSRVWILQEIVLAPKVFIKWGRRKAADLDEVINTANSEAVRDLLINDNTATGNRLRTAAPYFAAIGDLRESRHGRRSQARVEEVMYAFGGSVCTDRRDQVYGLLSLLSEDDKMLLPSPDYSIPSSSVFNSFATALLNKNRNYDLLSIINNTTTGAGSCSHYTHDHAASWAPQGDGEFVGYPLAPGVFFPKQLPLYKASSSDVQFSIFSPRDTASPTLTAHGVRLSEVYETLELEIAMDSQLGQQSIRTILEDRCFNSDGLTFRRIDWTNLSRDFGTEELDNLDVFGLMSVRGSRSQRRMATTRDNLLANVPAEARMGDVIVVLFGAAVPHVLRLAWGGESYRYRFVGECYVDGYMDGLAMAEYEEGKLKAEAFSLH